MTYRALFGMVALLAGESARAAEPASPTGILGQTEDQVKARFGPAEPKRLKQEAELAKYLKDRPLEAEFYERESRLRPPVVKQVWYSWKKLTGPGDGSLLRPGPVTYQAELRVGYDAQGVARAFEVDGGPKGWDVITAARNLAGSGWKPDPDLEKVFPPIHNKQILTSNRYIFWNDSGAGYKIGHEGIGPTRITGVRGSGFYRPVSASVEKRAYTVCDVPYDTLDSIFVRSLYVADADAFWTWTLADLMNGAKNGRDKVAPTLPRRDPNVPNQTMNPRGGYLKTTFEESLAGIREEDYEIQTAERLTAAILQVIRHPTVDPKLVRVPTEFLRERYDQKLSLQLIALLASPNESALAKSRAMEVMGHLDDPAMIAPLIAHLSDKAGKVAEASLQQITGQNLGAAPAAWLAWWKENQVALRKAAEVRYLDRSAGVKVGGLPQSKKYHTLDCPLLKQVGEYKPATMADVRAAGWQACPKCKPIR